MKRYVVEVADEAWDAIREHARYVAVDLRSPENAGRWLDRVIDTLNSLDAMPKRYSRDERQSERAGLDVYRLTFERTCVISYVVNEPKQSVRVISFRYGGNP